MRAERKGCGIGTSGGATRLEQAVHKWSVIVQSSYAQGGSALRNNTQKEKSF